MNAPHPAKTLALTVLLITSLVGVAMIQDRMAQLRRDAGLVDAMPVDDAPPLVAFTTVALGGFRGLMADILFLRLRAMQEQESFFEMVQLSHWIVNLQPRFTAISTFLSWNMAYNVSVMFDDPEVRWRWVENGIRLIRDGALSHNPNDPSLYQELAWLYYHKIGQNFDDAHKHYKARLGAQVTAIVGAYRDDVWQRLGAAPPSPAALRTALGPKAVLLDSWCNETGHSFTILEAMFRAANRLPEALVDRLVDDARVLEDCLRARWLRAALGLDPQVMATMMKIYGPLDFRLPDAHAIYWAQQGLEHAENGQDIGCERVRFQALKSAFLAGRVVTVPGIDAFEAVPNVGLAKTVRKAYVKAIEDYNENRAAIAGYENFMADAIVVLCTFGQRSEAEEFLRIARAEPRFQDTRRFRSKLNNFVVQELAGNIDTLSLSQAQAIVQALLLQAFQALAFGDYERASNFEQMAGDVYDTYTNAIGGAGRKDRRELPALPLLKTIVRVQFEKQFPDVLTQRLNAELDD